MFLLGTWWYCSTLSVQKVFSHSSLPVLCVFGVIVLHLGTVGMSCSHINLDKVRMCFVIVTPDNEYLYSSKLKPS